MSGIAPRNFQHLFEDPLMNPGTGLGSTGGFKIEEKAIENRSASSPTTVDREKFRYSQLNRSNQDKFEAADEAALFGLKPGEKTTSVFDDDSVDDEELNRQIAEKQRKAREQLEESSRAQEEIQRTQREKAKQQRINDLKNQSATQSQTAPSYNDNQNTFADQDQDEDPSQLSNVYIPPGAKNDTEANKIRELRRQKIEENQNESRALDGEERENSSQLDQITRSLDSLNKNFSASNSTQKSTASSSHANASSSFDGDSSSADLDDDLFSFSTTSKPSASPVDASSPNFDFSSYIAKQSSQSKPASLFDD